MGIGKGNGRGGARPGAGKPKGSKARWPIEVADAVRTLSDNVERLTQHHRNEQEALQPILRRLVAIEKALGLREPIQAPRSTRRRPLGVV